MYDSNCVKEAEAIPELVRIIDHLSKEVANAVGTLDHIGAKVGCLKPYELEPSNKVDPVPVRAEGAVGALWEQIERISALNVGLTRVERQLLKIV
jgi:hypothetical protein